MAAVIPVVAAIVTPSFFTIAGAALGVMGFVTGNKTLSMIGGLVGLAGAFAGGLAGAAGAEGTVAGAETAGAAGEASAATEAAAEAFQGADGISQGVAQGADTAANVVNEAGASQALNAVSPAQDYADGISQGATSSEAVTDLPGAAPPSTPAEALKTAPSGTENLQKIIDGQQAPPSASAQQVDPGVDYGGDTVLGRPGEGGLGAGPGGSMQKTWLDRILGSDFLKGDLTKAAAITTGGQFIAKGLGRNPQAEYVDLQKERTRLEQEELARRNANANNVGQVRVPIAPNPSANLYPQGYSPPRVGLINRARV